MSRTPLPLVVAAVVVTLFAPSLARADLVVPERAACDGKKAGDPCDGGVCTSAGHECRAGACRQFDSEGECAKNGCAWVEELRCAPVAPAAPAAPSTTPAATPAPATEAPRAAPPASCASTPATLAPGALVGLLLLRRRRRR
jgi:hypothetical protein